MKKNEVREMLHALSLERKKILGPRFQELGMKMGEGQPRILGCLLREGTMTQKELAHRCRVDVTTISRTLDRMERSGLLMRRVNPVCKRSHLIAITDRGEAMAREVQKIFAEFDNRIWEGIPEEEMKQLLETLEKIRKNLEEEETT